MLVCSRSISSSVQRAWKAGDDVGHLRSDQVIFKTGAIAFARNVDDERYLVAVLGELEVPIDKEPEN